MLKIYAFSKIYVTENQTVTSNDIIGAVGRGEAYDRCSTGAHLDFSIAQGIYGKIFIFLDSHQR